MATLKSEYARVLAGVQVTPPENKIDPDLAFAYYARTLESLAQQAGIVRWPFDLKVSSWDLNRMNDFLRSLPEKMLADAKLIANAFSVSELHRRAAKLKNAGGVDDDETVTAIFVYAKKLQPLPRKHDPEKIT